MGFAIFLETATMMHLAVDFADCSSCVGGAGELRALLVEEPETS